MPATGTIDLISYTNAPSDSASSAKSCADNSSDFENVLNEANKAYSSEDNSSKNTANEKTQKTTNETTENRNEKSEKITEKDEAKNSTEKVVDNDNTKKDSPKSDSVDKAKEKTETTNKTKSGKAKNSKEPELVKTEKESENKSDSPEEATQKAVQTPTQDSQTTPNATNTASDLPDENIVEILPATTDASDITKQDTNKATSDQNNQIQIGQTQPVQEDFSVDLSNLTDNLNDITTNNSNNVKVQTQTQQALSNLQINTQEVSPEAIQPKTSQQETQQPQTIQPQTSAETVMPQEKNSQTPAIEVKTDVVASNANVNSHLSDTNAKNNIQDNLDKANLTQEALDKTNAQVINVENSNSSGSNSNTNNLLQRQNAHEQAVKMELESNSNVQNDTPNVDLTNMQDANIQTVFDKTLDGTQSITQTTVPTATQEPKELNKTDILSQISNQLNTKKLQEELTTKVNIVLKPENLGKINLELINSKEGLTAQITAENAQVKELLSKSLDSLKDSLSNQGVNVHSVTVKVEETPKQSNNMFSFNDGQSKEGNQEFSNNAQKQNQNDFSFNEGHDNIATTDETEADVNIENNSELNSKIENTVSIGSSSGRVDYKV